MASDLNRVTLVGRMTRDAEVRHTQSGDPVISMRLAFSTRTKSGDNWEDRSNFIDVTHFARSEKLAEYLVKGKQVAVDGRLSWREWTDKEGGKRQSVEVIASEVQLLGGKDTGGGGSAHQPDDIPFGPGRI